MILATWNDRWFLASKAQSDTPSCALVAGDWQGLAELGFRADKRSVGAPDQPGYFAFYVWHRFMPTMQGVTFYPKVRYRGIEVFPQHWHPESSEPLLECHMPMNILPGETAQQSRERREALLDDGWEQSAWDGLAKYVHVDELEKIEGPAPDSAF